MSIRDLVILKVQIAILYSPISTPCALLAPNSRLITVHSAPVIFRSACTGGAQPPVARARAPVCPSLATPLVVSDTYLPRIQSCQSTHPGCVRYLPTKNTVLSVYPPWLCQIPTYQEYTVLLVYPPWLCQIPTYQEYRLVSLPTLVVSVTYLPRIPSC